MTADEQTRRAAEPAPLREEWGTRTEYYNGDVTVDRWDNREAAEDVAQDGHELVHCYVSDWLPVDGVGRAEGDGRAVL